MNKITHMIRRKEYICNYIESDRNIEIKKLKLKPEFFDYEFDKLLMNRLKSHGKHIICKCGIKGISEKFLRDNNFKKNENGKLWRFENK